MGPKKKHQGRRDGPCQLFIRFEELQEVQHPNLACALVELVVIRWIGPVPEQNVKIGGQTQKGPEVGWCWEERIYVLSYF